MKFYLRLHFCFGKIKVKFEKKTKIYKIYFFKMNKLVNVAIKYFLEKNKKYKTSKVRKFLFTLK
jgi:hypothetical protein